MKHAHILTLAGLATVTNLAAAGVADDARFALHRTSTTTISRTICTAYTPNASNIPCDDHVTTASINAYELIYIVVGHGPSVGINFVSFGIDYNGRAGQANGIEPEFNQWTMCADGLPFPTSGGFGEFPAPKGGTRVTWITCQQNDIAGRGTHAVIGALQVWAYAADQLSLTPNNNVGHGPELRDGSCDGSYPELLEVFPPFAWYALSGRVDLGGGAGLNPCLIVPVRGSTWGKIKAGYKR